MKDVSRCISKSVYQSPNLKGTTTFQIFGGDVIFTESMHPYLLEFNKGPDMTGRDGLDEMMKERVQKDILKTLGIIDDTINNSFNLIYERKL
jgi:hypothetical protein